MRFIDQQIGAGFALDLRDLGQRRRVTEHRIDAFDDDQLAARMVLQTTQPLEQVVRVVVPEADHFGVAEPGAVVDAGVAVGIEDQVILAAGQRRQHAQIGLVAGAEHHAVATAIKLGHRQFQIAVPRIAAVGDARTGGPGTEAADCRDRLLDAAFIEGQAQVVVGAEQYRLASIDDALGRRQDAVERDFQRVGISRAKPVVGLCQMVKLGKNAHARSFCVS